jgi:hypothetical protein
LIGGDINRKYIRAIKSVKAILGDPSSVMLKFIHFKGNPEKTLLLDNPTELRLFSLVPFGRLLKMICVNSV